MLRALRPIRGKRLMVANQPAKHAMLALVSLLLLSYGVSSTRCSSMPDNSTDMQSLLDFKQAITDPGGALNSWNSSIPHCLWEGVNCSLKHPGRVTVLSLGSLGLAGPISPSIGNLTFLETLDLSVNSFLGALPPLNRLHKLQSLVLAQNNLQGIIPDSLTNRSNLNYVDLSNNHLTGDIPLNIGLLSNLWFLGLSLNNLTGTIPPSLKNVSKLFSQKHCIYINGKIICRMYNPSVLQKAVVVSGATNAKALLLSNNKLSGALLANLGFSKLSYLALANNKLSGTIPSSIAEAQDTLFEVLLLNNQLSGCLPHELGMLHKAAVIDAGMNQLTGPIPSSFSCLRSVEQLNLGGNRLYGQVPDALCKLAAGPSGRLANLTLSGNYFTSVGPACSALIKDGVLDVKNNCIPGLANQRRPAECAAFQSQPKTCPAPAASTQVACPAAAAATGAVAPGERKARDYSSYVTYATLHE